MKPQNYIYITGALLVIAAALTEILTHNSLYSSLLFFLGMLMGFVAALINEKNKKEMERKNRELEEKVLKLEKKK